MYKILMNQDLGPDVHLFKNAAPAIAKKAQPGQFVVVRIDERGEHIPLTIADWGEDGSVTIIFVEVGTTTYRLALLEAGYVIVDFTGPIGRPSRMTSH